MEFKKRYPIISLLFSIVSPGLGQIYNGQLKKGILLYFLGLLILLSYSIVGLYFYGLIICLFITIVWLIYIYADSLFTAIKIKQIELNNYSKWYFYLIFLIIFNIITLGSKEYLTQIKAYSIPSEAMAHTLLTGDYILSDNAAFGVRNPFTNKVWIPISTPQRGDVVVFIFPQDHTKNYIRRVVGLPGDRIKIINKKVFINGQLHPAAQAVYGNPAITSAPLSPNDPGRDNLGPEIVPTNSYFVMGDNRDYSYDGQFWGFVPFDLIRGKALYIYFSQDQKNSMIRWERLGLPVN